MAKQQRNVDPGQEKVRKYFKDIINALIDKKISQTVFHDACRFTFVTMCNRSGASGALNALKEALQGRRRRHAPEDPKAWCRLFGFNEDGEKYLRLERPFEPLSHNISDQQIEWIGVALRFFEITSAKNTRRNRETGSYEPWEKYLGELLGKVAVQKFSRAGRTDSSESIDDVIWSHDEVARRTSQVVCMVEQYGLAAIVGHSCAERNILVKAVRARLPTRKIEPDTTLWIAPKSINTVDEYDTHYQSLWIETFVELVNRVQSTNQLGLNSFLSHVNELRRFYASDSDDVLSLTADERSFLNAIRAVKGEFFWYDFGEALQKLRLSNRVSNIDLITDIAKLVRSNLGNAVVILKDVFDFGSTKETADMLFDGFKPPEKSTGLRLLITSQQPNCLSFLPEYRNFTYILDPIETVPPRKLATAAVFTGTVESVSEATETIRLTSTGAFTQGFDGFIAHASDSGCVEMGVVDDANSIVPVELHFGNAVFEAARSEAERICNAGYPQNASQAFIHAIKREEQAEQRRQQDRKRWLVRLLEEAVAYDKRAASADAAFQKLRLIAEIIHPGDRKSQMRYLFGRASQYQEMGRLKGDNAALLIAISSLSWLAKDTIDGD
jgi:hypothetical protein